MYNKQGNFSSVLCIEILPTDVKSRLKLQLAALGTLKDPRLSRNRHKRA
jgi:hypothetical protein